VECFESLRASIADYKWSPITSGLPVTASIGVVIAPADGNQRSNLLRIADNRLYMAKHAGRNRVVHAAPDTAIG
jgi:two-component system, cell cycle response regulator